MKNAFMLRTVAVFAFVVMTMAVSQSNGSFTTADEQIETPVFQKTVVTID